MCDIIRKKVYLSFDVGTKNLAYCLLDEDGMILLWNLCNISASTYEKQCDNMISELDKMDYKTRLNDENYYDMTVLIERQMSRNPKMRIVSGQLQMYYCMEARIQNKNSKIYISKIKFYSPKNKLKCYKPEEGDEPIIPKTYKNAYDQRKYLAKQHCDRIIRRKHNKEIIEFFEKNKKKADDLSDTFLQGIAYISGL
jgi:hypothetical protein